MTGRLLALARREGSTRPVALLRVGLALLLWSRYAAELAPWAGLDPVRLYIGISFYLSTGLMFVGLWTRLACGWAALTLWLIFLFLGAARGDLEYLHHHTTLLLNATFLLALTPAGGSYSIDRWRAVRAARRAGQPPPPERGPLWAAPLIALQVSLVYFWGAYDKTNLAFLSGARLEHIVMERYAGSDYPAWPGFHALMVAGGVGTVALEYALAFGLWSRRLRPWLVGAGVAFHGVIYALFPVHTFSATMWLLYLAYFDPDDVHRAIDAISGHDGV